MSTSRSLERQAIRRLVLVGLAAVLLAGCRVDAAVTIDVAADGGGQVALDLTVDDELRDRLLAAGQDPAAVLPAAPTAAWVAAPVARPGATGQRLTAPFDEPTRLGALVDDLTAGLDPDDGAVLEQVALSLDDDGYRLALRGGIAPPAVAGIRVEGEDAPDLAGLLAASGSTATLRATFPTVPTVVAGDGVVQGTTATVTLPVGELEQVVLTAPRPPLLTQRQMLVGGVAVGLLLVAALLGWRTRRTRRG